MENTPSKRPLHLALGTTKDTDLLNNIYVKGKTIAMSEDFVTSLDAHIHKTAAMGVVEDTENYLRQVGHFRGWSLTTTGFDIDQISLETSRVITRYMHFLRQKGISNNQKRAGLGTVLSFRSAIVWFYRIGIKHEKRGKIEWSEGTLSGNPAMCDAVRSLLKTYVRESKGEVSQSSQALTYQKLR